jgi:hypothetical protein
VIAITNGLLQPSQKPVKIVEVRTLLVLNDKEKINLFIDEMMDKKQGNCLRNILMAELQSLTVKDLVKTYSVNKKKTEFPGEKGKIQREYFCPKCKRPRRTITRQRVKDSRYILKEPERHHDNGAL